MWAKIFVAVLLQEEGVCLDALYDLINTTGFAYEEIGYLLTISFLILNGTEI